MLRAALGGPLSLEATVAMEVFRLDIENLHERLRQADVDPVAGIRLESLGTATINGDLVEYSVAEIHEEVAPHVHRGGDETYFVVAGRGEMFVGPAKSIDSPPDWSEPVDVGPGDTFVIPAEHAHCLRNAGQEPLLIVFFGAPANLTTDRTLVPGPGPS